MSERVVAPTPDANRLLTVVGQQRIMAQHYRKSAVQAFAQVERAMSEGDAAVVPAPTPVAELIARIEAALAGRGSGPGGNTSDRLVSGS